MAHVGQLLVASPGVHDGIFDRTVVLLLDHDQGGSMGLVLNRPSELRVADALPEFSPIATPDRIFLGGPVEEGTALVMAEPVDLDAATLHYQRDGVGLIDLTDGGMDSGPALSRVRVYSGYAGWGPGQLDDELRSDAWLVADAQPDDPWHTDSDDLWSAVLRRQQGPTRFLAIYPDEPSLN